MTEQWQELKETIIELRDNDGTGTQQEVCKFLANLMNVLEKQMQEPKTGQWILDETDNSITCDKCGCLIWANDIHNGEAYYCPNCGIKMEVEHETD